MYRMYGMPRAQGRDCFDNGSCVVLPSYIHLGRLQSFCISHALVGQIRRSGECSDCRTQKSCPVGPQKFVPDNFCISYIPVGQRLTN